MADPLTTNIQLAVPLRATDVGTWDVPVNGDFTIIDQCFGGVQTYALNNSNVNVTVSQAQNSVIRLTGTLTSSVSKYYFIQRLRQVLDYRQPAYQSPVQLFSRLGIQWLPANRHPAGSARRFLRWFQRLLQKSWQDRRVLGLRWSHGTQLGNKLNGPAISELHGDNL